MATQSTWGLYERFNMKEVLLYLAIALSALVEGVEVQDERRDCPLGFFYAGEVPEVETRGEIWSMGETSPVYSCYSIKSGSLDWVSASQECFEQKAQLLSINNNMEENILEGNVFKENLLQNVTEVWTSGVSLKKGNWTWFGAGESVNQTILDVLETANTTDNTDTLCMIISWNEMNNLTYSAYLVWAKLLQLYVRSGFTHRLGMSGPPLIGSRFSLVHLGSFDHIVLCDCADIQLTTTSQGWKKVC